MSAPAAQPIDESAARAAIDHIKYVPYSRDTVHYRDAEAAFTRGDYAECIKCVDAAEDAGSFKVTGW